MTHAGWNHVLVESNAEKWRAHLRTGAAVPWLQAGTSVVAERLFAGLAPSLRDLVGHVEALAAAVEKRVNLNTSTTLVARTADLRSLVSPSAALFSWGFSDGLATAGGMAAKRDQLVRGAKGPDETASYGQFEFAREAFRRGKIRDGLEALQKAVSGTGGKSQGHPREWRFHYLKGLFLLGSFAHPSETEGLAEAEGAFAEAAQLAGKGAALDAAWALLAAGWAAAVQGGDEALARALERTDAALKLAPGEPEAAFQAAKVRMALGRVDEAVPFLQKAAARQALYVVKALSDGDFHRHAAALEPSFRVLRSELSQKAAALVVPLAARVRPLMEESDLLKQLPAAVRVVACADGLERAGLLDLWGYVPDGLEADKHELESLRLTLRRVRFDEWDEEVVEHRLTGEKRMVPTGAVEKIHTGEMEEYEETQPQEYEEDVEVSEPRLFFFRRVVRKRVRKVRQITVRRSRERVLERPVLEEQAVVEEIHRTVHHDDRENVAWVIASGVEIVAPVVGTPVTVPAGLFVMGGVPGDAETAEDEKPQHEVTITRPFELWNVPVTQALYEGLMGNNPSYFKKGGSYPVEYVTFYDAVLFCNALSRSRGLPEAYVVDDTNVHWHGLEHPGWRLPTEAEWEYACRAGGDRSRYGELDAIAWHEGNAGKATHPVMLKQPNDWGLYDMLGNIWEWVWDWKSAYEHYPRRDPTGPSVGLTRIFRGGSWSHVTRRPRAAVRNDIGPGFRYSYLGFRPARTILSSSES